MNSVGFSGLPTPPPPPAPPSRGTNGLPAGRQKPPCRFAPEVLMSALHEPPDTYVVPPYS